MIVVDLKELLGVELYEQVTAKLGDKRLGVVSDGTWIPKARFDDLNEERKQYKTQVDELNQQLGALQKQLKDNEGAKATIDQLKQQIADKETELAATRKTNAIKLQVLQAGPNDVADILPHIKADTVTIANDGSIKGLAEQITALQESKPYLFKAQGPDGTGGKLGNPPRDSKKPGVSNPWAKETFNLTEQGRMLRADPEQAKLLMAQAK